MFHSMDENGFTLLEILIAITILSVALIGMAGLLTTNVKSISRGKYQLIGLNLAQEQLESLKMDAATDFAAVEDKIITLPTTPITPDDLSGWDLEELGGVGALVDFPVFTRRTYIIDRENPPGVINMKDIAVLVLWQDVSGKHDVMVRTTIAR